MNDKQRHSPGVSSNDSTSTLSDTTSNTIGIPPAIANIINPTGRSSIKGIPNHVLSRTSTPSLLPKPIVIEPTKISNINIQEETKIPIKSPIDNTPILINGVEINRDDIPKISTAGLVNGATNLGKIARSKNPRYSPGNNSNLGNLSNLISNNHNNNINHTNNNINHNNINHNNINHMNNNINHNNNNINHHNISNFMQESKSEISSPQFIKGLSPHYTVPGSNREIIHPNPVPDSLVFAPLEIDKIPNYTIEDGVPTPNRFSVRDEEKKEVHKFPDIFPDILPDKFPDKFPDILPLNTPKKKDIPKEIIVPLEIIEEKKEVGAQISMEQKFSIPKFSEMTDDEKLYCRIGFEVDFAKWAQWYPHFKIEKPRLDEPLESLHIKKIRYIKQMYSDQTTHGFREYLILFWACLELFVVKVLGLNASGYTMSQIMRMNQYDSILQELGEKYTSDLTSQLPVEARLAFYTAVHTFTFVFFNYLSKWIGPNLAMVVRTFIDNFSTGRSVQPVTDANGNVIMPSAIPREGTNSVMGVPVGTVVQGITSMMAPSQNPTATTSSVPSVPPVKKPPRPPFKDV